MERDLRVNNPNQANRITKAVQADGCFRLPDPPEREAGHAAAVFDAMHKQGICQELLPLLGSIETTLITAGRYVIPHAGADTARIPYPHMMVARNVDVVLVEASKAYVISEHGKPPDWVIMLASDEARNRELEEELRRLREG